MKHNDLNVFDFFLGLLLGLAYSLTAGLGTLFTSLGDVFQGLFEAVIED